MAFRGFHFLFLPKRYNDPQPASEGLGEIQEPFPHGFILCPPRDTGRPGASLPSAPCASAVLGLTTTPAFADTRSPSEGRCHVWGAERGEQNCCDHRGPGFTLLSSTRPRPHREVAVRSHTGICSTPSPNKPQHARELRGPVKGDSTRSHAGVRVALLLKHTWNRPNRMSPPV